MAFVPLPNTAMLELVYQIDNQYVENTFYYLGDWDDDTQALEDLATNGRQEWVDNIQPLQSTVVRLVQIKATDMRTEGARGVILAAQPGDVGTHGSPMLPLNVAAVISLKTILRGRSYRGRVYHPGLCEDQVTNSNIATATAADLTAAYGDFTQISTVVGPATLAVASRYHNGLPRTQGVLTQVTTVICQSVVGSQRRRLPGRGI